MEAVHKGWRSWLEEHHPIYNGVIMFKIVYGQGWKYFLLLVPVLGWILAIVYPVRTAQVFGKGIGFGILNLFFAPITTLILAFGDAQYEGPVYSFI